MISLRCVLIIVGNWRSTFDTISINAVEAAYRYHRFPRRYHRNRRVFTRRRGGGAEGEQGRCGGVIDGVSSPLVRVPAPTAHHLTVNHPTTHLTTQTTHIKHKSSAHPTLICCEPHRSATLAFLRLLALSSAVTQFFFLCEVLACLLLTGLRLLCAESM